jgi:osmoprotectant transport system ATP-binding protein
MINGLMRPDSGTVRVFDEAIDYDRLVALRRQIGYALQGVGLFPHLTVRQNIIIQARLAQWPAERIDKRLHELIGFVNLVSEKLSKYPHQLSGGEQQRVGLCRAIMIDPPVVLLDEAFGALDPITRNEIHREFLHLQKIQARTIVLVTHDLREALKLADYIFILNRGVLQQSGRKRDVLSKPANPFVGEFFHDQLRDVPDVDGDV